MTVGVTFVQQCDIYATVGVTYWQQCATGGAGARGPGGVIYMTNDSGVVLHLVNHLVYNSSK